MKAKYMLILVFYLYSLINAQFIEYTYNFTTLHEKSETAKICQLNNGDVLVLSSGNGVQITNMTKFDKSGHSIYEKKQMLKGYSPSTLCVESRDSTKTTPEYYLFHHNKQKISTSSANQDITTFKDEGEIIQNFNVLKRIYQGISMVPLKTGKIVLVGINSISVHGDETSVDVNVYNPTENKIESGGISFVAYGKFISCFEQKVNEVYCLYANPVNMYINSLNIKYMKIKSNGISIEDIEPIKMQHFHSVFDFMKAVSLSETEAAIIVQIGEGNKNKEIPFGNSGKDLFFFHIVSNGGKIDVKRMEYLSNSCSHIDDDDGEYYNADIIALSEKRIIAVCESGDNKFQGFSISIGEKHIERFEFTPKDAAYVKNPTLAKFDKNVGFFYTYISDNKDSKVVFSFVDYPDCEDYSKTPVLLPRNLPLKITLCEKVFMGNPYSDLSNGEIINARIINSTGTTVYNVDTKEVILENTDLAPNTKLEVIAESNEGIFDFEFASIKKDPTDGDIIGKTCKIQFNTPKCLDQCYSCNQTGNEGIHYCYGCKNESYFINNTFDKNANGFGELHNCYPCNKACKSCYGDFIPKITTNCKKCFIEKGYYPFEGNETICIGEDTQDYWEEIFGVGIYLYKPGDDKETWFWRTCHPHCRKCLERGDKDDNKCIYCIKDYLFFCNQTEGHGIPGSCYNNCVDNGFYRVVKDGRPKCCPCLNHCKRCQDNPLKCNKCFDNWFLALNHSSCDAHCDYCLAEDTNDWECVNCWEKNNTYTLNKSCVPDKVISTKTKEENSMEKFIEFNLTHYHVIDEKCNLLMGCFGGCQTCDPWFSDKCTSCKKDTYKEDDFNRPKNVTFRCFKKDECTGVIDYIYDKELRVGGVPYKEDGQNVCLNCKYRNNSFRQPENDFYCGEKRDKTFVDIEEYNKLSNCYFRCKSCESWGNSYLMNCTACRDGNNYEFVKPDIKKKYGNCYRKAHKCGVYPYYHDYDLAPFVGRDEDDCGEYCDVCLYNFSCTENYPYFIYETHECVEYCPVTQVLNGECQINHTVAAIILLRNPFGLKNPYDFLNTSITISQFISSSFFQYFAKSYNLDVVAITDQLNGMFGNGQLYNIPEPRIIAGNNITIELTTFKLELEKIEKWLNGEGGNSGNSGKGKESALDLTECQAILKKKYGLPEEEDLMIIKADMLKELNDYYGTSVEYQIFSTSLGAFLPLADCQEAGTTVTVSNPFNIGNLLTQYQSKTGSVVVNGYNVFDVNSPFYNDICTDFTNENGNDVLLDDRRKDYFDENINLCETGCKFVGYNTTTNLYTCICNIKAIPGVEAEEYTGDIITNEMPKDFRDLISKRSNIEVFKCASQVFSSKGQKKNFGSYILLTGLASLIGIIIFHFVKEKGKMDSLFNQLARIPNRIANPPKPTGTQDEKKAANKNSRAKDKNQKVPDNSVNKVKVRESDVVTNSKRKINNEEKSKPRNIQKDLFLTEDQLNFAEFHIASKKDHRSFIKYYWSLLKMKQLFVFTFYTSDDFILRTTKIALFILFIGFYLTFTALFFNDSIMRAIYIYKGNTNAAVHIPNIILSSLCCLVASLIIRFVSLNEREISKITQLNNEKERKQLAEKMKSISKVKLIVMYAISGALLFLFWYYVSAFCAVFKNSQGHYFTNVLVAFILCNLWPCVISLIPALLRKRALDNGNETLYKVSQIISYF